MKKLYLIRRQLETILGPMTVEELRKSYERLEFGPDDEVAGHCRPWVMIDSRQRLREVYPELQQVLGQKSGALPLVSIHDQKRRIVRGGKASLLNLSSANIFFMGAVIGILAVVVLSFRAELADKLRATFSRDLDAQYALDLILQGEESAFTKYIETHLDKVVAEATSSRKSFQTWLPVLRSFAYWGEGQVPGIKAALLRGQAGSMSPLNCSQASWKQRWKFARDELKNFAEAQTLGGKIWARVLLWDASWVNWRVETAHGWQVPQNYYAFCIKMAYKGFVEQRTDLLQNVSEEVLDQIETRLLTLDEAQQQRSFALTPFVSDDKVLSLLNCVDRAADSQALDQCQQAITEGWSKDWQKFGSQYLLVKRIRVLVSQIGPLEDQQLEVLESAVEEMSFNSYHFTQLDLNPELRFAKLALLYRGDLAAARQKLVGEFPDIKP